MNRSPLEILFDNVLAGAAYASQSSDSASVKEQHMDNVNHPKHYENGPFECIELTRLLSFDWGNVVKYCYRWQSKNGVEDLKKALWYANDAVIHGTALCRHQSVRPGQRIVLRSRERRLGRIQMRLVGIREQLSETRHSNGPQEQDQRNRKGR